MMNLDPPLSDDVERELWARMYVIEFERLTKLIKVTCDHPHGLPHDIEGRKYGATRFANEAVIQLRERCVPQKTVMYGQ